MIKMKITGSTNIKSFNKGQSYKQLRYKHFDAKDREIKGISKNKNLEKLNDHVEIYDEYEIFKIYDQLENDIIEYNGKKSQIKNKSRRYKNLDDYVEKRRTQKRANKDFHGLEFMMVSKLGSMESWQQVVNEFEKHGVNEEDTLNCLNDAFNEYAKDFNESFYDSGLTILEYDTNLDEIGAPHMHSRVFLNRKLKNGLPDTNLSNALKDKYGGNLTNKELMERFRLDLDNSIVDKSSEALKDLARQRGFEYEGLEMIRLESEQKGLTHEAYKEQQERKRQQKEIQSQQEKLQSQKQELTQRSKALDVREDSIASREALLDERDIKVSQREEKAFKTQQSASEMIQKAKDMCNNLEDLENKLKRESKLSEDRLVKYICNGLLPKTQEIVHARANKYWQSGKFKAITNERDKDKKQIDKMLQDAMQNLELNEDEQQKDNDIEIDF